MRSLAVLFFFSAVLCHAQISPFNGIPIGPAPDGNYRLVISGHFHGASHDRSGYPAATLLANIDTINGLNAQILLSTGDLFLDPETDHQRYERSFFSKLNVPLFNAPGNHDKGEYYDREFGGSDQVITIGKDRIVLFDTERNNGSLDDAQIGLLQELLEGDAPRRVFIVSHRPIWSEKDERYGPLFEGNTRAILGTNYSKEIGPLIERIAERSEVFWTSGSMAGEARSSIFFQPHAPNITFIQSAIRNELRDALLIADVKPDTINWSALSLTGQQLLRPQEYDAQWWWSQKGKREGFNWRLVPYLIRSTITHRAFWWGLAAGILLLSIARLALRRGV